MVNWIKAGIIGAILYVIGMTIAYQRIQGAESRQRASIQVDLDAQKEQIKQDNDAVSNDEQGLMTENYAMFEEFQARDIQSQVNDEFKRDEDQAKLKALTHAADFREGAVTYGLCGAGLYAVIVLGLSMRRNPHGSD